MLELYFSPNTSSWAFTLFTEYSTVERPNPSHSVRSHPLLANWHGCKTLQMAHRKKSLCIPYSFNDVAEICFLQHFLSPSEVVCLHFSSVLKWQVREGGGMYKQESRLKWSSIWNIAQARHKNTLIKDTYNLYLPLHIHLTDKFLQGIMNWTDKKGIIQKLT